MDADPGRTRAMTVRLMGLLLGWLSLSGPAAALPLWELTGTSNRVVLLGSIHFLRESDLPLPAPITDALHDADVIYMELDMDDMDPVANQAALLSLARDPGGRSLSDLVGPANWRDARARAGELGLDVESLQPFEPWYAALALTQMRLAQLGFDASMGLESTLVGDAGRQGKNIRGLETFAGQLRALDTLPGKAQAAFLLATLEEAADIADSVDTLITAWKRGDARTLESELLASLENQPDVYRQLVVERNRAFSREIARLADQPQDYLVVVGTLHLVGPDSVQRMLAEAGQQSRQLQ